MKRLMITGAKGFLGGRLAAYYADRFEIVKTGHEELDIIGEEEVRTFLNLHHPDLVLHCGAISDTGMCERTPELSRTVNVEGAVNLAGACKETGSRLVFMSSDQIYAGSPHLRPNREDIDAAPVNVYGRHKKEAEENILALLPDAVCLRLPWMYDFPVRGLKSNSNLLCNLLKALISGRPMKMAVYDYRGITYVQEVVRNMEAAMKLPGGVYNFGSPGTVSAYAAAAALLAMIAKDRTDILTADQERFAGHPRNLTMDIGKIGEHGIYFPDTVEGFKWCLEDNPEYVRAFLS